MYLRALFKQEARRALSGQYPAAMAVALIASLMPLILFFAPANPALIVLSLLIMGPLLLAVCRYFLAASSPKRPAVANFFSAFNDAFTACLAYLWQCLWALLWLMLFIVPGIIKLISYAMQFFLLAEYPALGARRSLELSQRLTDGYKWELFVTYLSFTGWALLSIATCGIALIYVLPYYYTTMAQIYRYLKEQALIDGRITPADLPKKHQAPKAPRPKTQQPSPPTASTPPAETAASAPLTPPAETGPAVLETYSVPAQAAVETPENEALSCASLPDSMLAQSTPEEDITHEQQ